MFTAWLVWVLFVTVLILWHGFVDMVLVGFGEGNKVMITVGLLCSFPLSFLSFWLSVRFLQLYIPLIY